MILELPADIRDTVLCARHLKLLAGSGVCVYVRASDQERSLLALVNQAIGFYDPRVTPGPADALSCELCKLSVLAGETSFPYMAATDALQAAAAELVHDCGKVKIGICLDEPGDIAATLLSAFTLNQLMNLDFYILPGVSPPLSVALPEQVSFTAVAPDLPVDVCTAVLNRMDIVIANENLFGHLAGALGKAVWLLASGSDQWQRIKKFLSSYLGVTLIAHQKEYLAVALRRISLYLYFDFADVFTPFSTDCKTDINVEVPRIPTFKVSDISQLDDILEITVSCLNNVQIETTTVCNLACPYCPNSMVGRKPAFMDEDTYYRIIDSLREYDPEYSGTVSPHFYGEPLIDTRLETFIGYTRRTLPKAAIELFTNGELLTIRRFVALKEAGVDLFRISQHTLEPSPVLMETLDRIERFHPELNTVDFSVFHNLPYKMNRGGLVDTTPFPEAQTRFLAGCSIAHRFLTIDYRGDAVLCCNDYLSRHTFGNIAGSSIRDIWDGVEYRKVRNLLMYGYLPYEICRICCGLTPRG